MSSLISAYTAKSSTWKPSWRFYPLAPSLSGQFCIILDAVLSSKLWKPRAKGRWHRGWCRRRWLIWHFIPIRLLRLIWTLESDIFWHLFLQTGGEVAGERKRRTKQKRFVSILLRCYGGKHSNCFLAQVRSLLAVTRRQVTPSSVHGLSGRGDQAWKCVYRDCITLSSWAARTKRLSRMRPWWPQFFLF